MVHIQDLHIYDTGWVSYTGTLLSKYGCWTFFLIETWGSLSIYCPLSHDANHGFLPSQPSSSMIPMPFNNMHDKTINYLITHLAWSTWLAWNQKCHGIPGAWSQIDSGLCAGGRIWIPMWSLLCPFIYLVMRGVYYVRTLGSTTLGRWGCTESFVFSRFINT